MRNNVITSRALFEYLQKFIDLPSDAKHIVIELGTEMYPIVTITRDVRSAEEFHKHGGTITETSTIKRIK